MVCLMGKMDREQLENVLFQFIEGGNTMASYLRLIIETGVDIS